MTNPRYETVQLRPVLFGLGGVHREDVAALQALLLRTQEELDAARQHSEQQRQELEDDHSEIRRLHGELTEANSQLQRRATELDNARREARRKQAELLTQIKSLRSALDESAGWAERLPRASEQLMSIAAGVADPDGLAERLAASLREVVGSRLLASVEISVAQPEPAAAATHATAELELQTQRDERGRPIRTTTRLGQHLLSCVWDPRADPGEDTIEIVGQLCQAALFSLDASSGLALREARGMVTQLGDAQAHRRHLALRKRLHHPTGELSVQVEADSAGRYRKLFGEIAWEASLADAAVVLEELAYAYGGQAYQVEPLSFRVLLEHDRAEEACAEARQRLGFCELDFDVHASQ